MKKRPTVTFSTVWKGEPLTGTPFNKADYDFAIAMGWGHLITVEGFTIRETRDLLWGDPDADPAREFDGLKRRRYRDR